MLYIIGLGLGDEMDITMRAWYIIRNSDLVFLDSYTSVLNVSSKALEEFYGKDIILADRKLVETQSDKILEPAKKQNVALLVVGDPMFATTHSDLVLRARDFNVKVKIIHNTSVFNTIADTGLSLYNFGKVASIPFTDDKWEVNTPYNVLKENKDLHTLFLFDLRPEKNEFMTINQAIKFLEDCERRLAGGLIHDDLFLVACSSLGTDNQQIKAGILKELKTMKFRKFPQCLIIPGKMHFVEEQMLELFK